MTTVLDHATPVARKPHLCDECGGTIGTGDRYVRQRNVSDDGPYVYKAHSLCWSLIDWAEMAYCDDSCIDWHEKREELAEVWSAFAALCSGTAS